MALLVGGDGVVQPLQFVEHVAEIEEGEGVAGVGLGGAPVHAFGAFEVALVVGDGAEIDAGGRVVGLEREDRVVALYGLGQGGVVFFKLHGADEHLLQLGCGCGPVAGGAAADKLEVAALVGGEVEAELLGDGVDQGAGVAEDEPRAEAHGAGLRQGVAHAGDALHGIHLGADGAGGDAAGAHFT